MMISFRQFLKEANINDLMDKRDKLNIQLDDAKHDLNSHIKMKRFTDDNVQWAEKYKSLQLRIETLNNNIKTNEEQIKIAREEENERKNKK